MSQHNRRQTIGGERGGRYGSRRRNRGLSLMELLLVLALMVAVAALTLPALRGPMENQRLRKSADAIRAEWNKARNRAMRTGRIQVFRFEINGSHFVVEPWYSADDYLESSDGLAAGVDPLNPGLVAPAPIVNVIEPEMLELPEGVLFFTGDAAVEVRSLMIEEALRQVESRDTSWSRPIFFYPDGETSTAQLILTNRQEQYIRLDLRGLTGIAQVSDLMTVDELTR
jgi:type II secretion system protein H